MIGPPSSWPVTALLLVYVAMGLEAWLAAVNERWLLARGARVIEDRSFPWMRVTYPAGFLAVIIEGWWRGGPPGGWSSAGIAIFSLGKLVKYAAIGSLGKRWSFRVLVLPGADLVTHGIYAVLRHPNYVGVALEVVGIALWMQAPITGTLFAVTFGLILAWRIRIEERALRPAPSR